jgi:hypothetical protein
MTNRVTFGAHDFEKLPKQIERDHESKKLVVLIERVKRQIAARAEQGFNVARPAAAAGSDSSAQVVPIRPVTVQE